MRSILVLTRNRQSGELIAGAVGTGHKVDISTISAFEDIDRDDLKSRDTTFIDIDLLVATGSLGKAPEILKKSLSNLWEERSDLKIIVVTPPDRIRDAVKAISAGASTYVTDPIISEEVRLEIESLDDQTLVDHELDYLRDQFWQVEAKDILRTNNLEMRKVFESIRSVAPTKMAVLLTGETGTGKGVMAQLIHQHSQRRDRQFIEIHCGAIPDTLLESELFGHEKGAFTGAVSKKLGKFEVASGGTIFLDEIGTITSSMQIKLLQVLQDQTIQRIGAESSIELDTRIIAATNEDLNHRRLDGSFRSDLYYRLNVYPVVIPALRHRREDIPLLADHFLKRCNQQYGKDIVRIHPVVLKAFHAYDWPGNIRELENLIERAYIIERSSTLSPDSFPSDLFSQDALIANIPVNLENSLAEARQKAVHDFESQYLTELLQRHEGRLNRAAEAAGVTYRQLSRLMSKHCLNKRNFRKTGKRHSKPDTP